ncbi:hypothetical protein SESBI_48250 [Sesbania bispinosa]|nr:hypothetical protein SESBI_48250 [Sesbania bispinosa]
MRGGRTLRSARVLTALTGEEKDQLDQSKKRAKHTDSHETFVAETQVAHDNDQLNGVEGKEPRKIFSTAIGESIKRGKVTSEEERDEESMDGDSSPTEVDSEDERFGSLEDVNRVFRGGPWMILDHYLMVRKWHPQFFPQEDELKRVAVWVCVPGLPIEYYDHHILWRVGGSLGNMLKEGLHLICFQCGRYGQRRDSCGREQHDGATTEVDQNPKNFGTWTVAQRKSHRNSVNKPLKRGNSDKKDLETDRMKVAHGTHFVVLREENLEENIHPDHKLNLDNNCTQVVIAKRPEPVICKAPPQEKAMRDGPGSSRIGNSPIVVDVVSSGLSHNTKAGVS